MSVGSSRGLLEVNGRLLLASLDVKDRAAMVHWLSCMMVTGPWGATRLTRPVGGGGGCGDEAAGEEEDAAAADDDRLSHEDTGGNHLLICRNPYRLPPVV